MLKKIYIATMAILTLLILAYKLVIYTFFDNYDDQNRLSAVGGNYDISSLFAVVYPSEEIDSHLNIWLSRNKFSNVTLFSKYNGLNDLEKSKAFISSIKGTILKDGGQPLIMMDQEGGRVNRLLHLFGSYPSARDMAAMTSLERIQVVGDMASRLEEIGVNVNLAPVVDCSLPEAYMGSRSFGQSSEKVIECAEDFIQACHSKGIGCVLKHFPGIGSSMIDPHEDFISSNMSKDQYLKNDLVPYKKLQGLSGAVMTAHIKVAKVDDKIATLSKTWITDILRNELGYKGVVLTDSLSMQSILGHEHSRDQIIIRTVDVIRQALLAGCDMLLLCPWEWSESVELNDYPQMVQEIVAKVNSMVKQDLELQKKVIASLKRIKNLKENKLDLHRW